MAEGLMKKFFGHDIYVQSAGVMSDIEIDGFAIAVCAELDVELGRHRSRDFDEIERAGDAMSGFDMVVALTPNCYHKAQEYAKIYALDVLLWPIDDPTAIGTKREEKLDAYRAARDQIADHIRRSFSVED
jgi:protein-tyrosine-phosphatase